MNSLPKSNLIVKLRNNLYQLPAGQLVGFGPEHPGGYGWCFNCYTADCAHVEAITQSWLDGMSIEANSIPFNGMAPTVADDDPWKYPKGYGNPDVGLSEATI